MSKIKVLNKEGEEVIFEKSGIKQEFRISDIDDYIGILAKQKEEVTSIVTQLTLLQAKIEDPGLDIAQKDEHDFLVYANYRNQIQIAEKAIQELEGDNIEFAGKFDSLSEEAQGNVAKWIGYIMQTNEKMQELSVLDDTIKEYEADKASALSCLDKT
ncbi:hypothetical protein N8148_02790 [Gammaproteobacteria bacterium]|nr:hypothetical protein [Gammaproteobacteria bacterium]